MSKIIKRNGSLEEFDMSKILNAVAKAYLSTGHTTPDDILAQLTASKDKFIEEGSVEKIQDHIESILFEHGSQEAYDAFTKYRESHALQREIRTKDIFESIINVESNDVTKDNANMNSESPAGMMMKFASTVTKEFVDRYLISKPVKKWMDDNKLYVHDKDYYPTMGLNCLQAPLDRILENGFRAGHGEARPAKRIETAAVQAAIVLESTQNEMFGGQAIPAFDFYMAPFVRMTYQEEIDNLRNLFVKFGKANFTPNSDKCWDSLKNVKIKDYLITDDGNIPFEKYMKGKIDLDVLAKSTMNIIIQAAINKTVKRVHQAMESFIHNMNSIHSRGGNQVVFSSINYGTDTSAEGRCIIRELLLSTERGVGNNSTAIFPIQIWKMKSGVSIDPGDPNYDLYQLACRVSGKRFFPNFLNLDSSFNTDDAWKVDDPKRYLHEVATMGCRTRVYENRFGEKTSVGRGNLSFSTLNFPKIAVEVAIKNGYLVKTENGYEFNHDKDDDYKTRVEDFMNELHELVKVAGCQLDERFKFQAKAFKKQFPLLMSGLWNGSEKLNPDDTIESVINQGTLGVGFIGLAEALIALIGKHHGESDLAQQVGLDIIKTMKVWINDLSDKYQHNYAIIGTPAEGLSGYFTKRDVKTFGVIEGVTDKTYYTNSNHVPVYYKCTPTHKAEIEGPYHKYTTGGHIFYVEADYDTTKNPEAIDTINRIARDNDAGYISINHKQGRCCYCNYESNDPNVTEGTECPVCHRKGMRILQRITGYLVGTTDSWNAAKLSELHDRVVHTK